MKKMKSKTQKFRVEADAAHFAIETTFAMKRKSNAAGFHGGNKREVSKKRRREWKQSVDFY
jgi:hypothetical protein